MFKTFQLTARHFRGVSQLLKVETCAIIPTQNYARFAPRTKSTIINEDELFNVDVPTPTPPTIKEPKPKLSKSKAKDTKECNEEMGKQLYTKLYENDKILTSIMMSLKSKKQRKKNDLVLLEGIRLIEDALQAGIELETLLFSRYEDIKHLSIPNKDTKLYKVPYRSIQLWSTLTTCPGVMGFFKKPKPLKEAKNSLPIIIICDNVRDPGNMGSILRAAAGVGCEKIILTKGCVDFWDPKVLRSAAGAHFRIPIYSSLEWNDITPLLYENAHVFVADNNIQNYAKNYKEMDVLEDVEEDEEENSKEGAVYADEKLNKIMLKKSKTADLLEKYNDLPIVPYYAVDYSRNHVILIVGGETEGLSRESFKLIESKQGLRVNIPLDNGVDSLNAGMALGIVAFEVKRQFLNIKNKLRQKAQ